MNWNRRRNDSFWSWMTSIHSGIRLSTRYLGEVLRYPSKALHLVLATRMDPALDLLLLRSYQRINEIRAQAL